MVALPPVTNTAVMAGQPSARESVNIGHLVTKRAELTPDVEAIVDTGTGRRLTFAELNVEVNKVANALSTMGVVSGQSVALLMMNSADMVAAFFACAKLGVVVVPVNWRLTVDELAFIVADAEATVLMYGPEFTGLVGDVRGRSDVVVNHYVQTGSAPTEPVPEWARELRPLVAGAPAIEIELNNAAEDLLFIMYTSGTTGHPKGVMHSHLGVLWAMVTLDASSDTHLGDRYLVSLPMFHLGALMPVIAASYAGATLVVQRSFDPVRTWELIGAERITSGLLVPTMLQMMWAARPPHELTIASLRWMMCGAAPVPVALIEAYAVLGVQIHQAYGLTETAGPLCLVGPDAALARIGSTGRPTFHTEVRVVDTDGNDVGAGGTGEIISRSPHTMLGYWKRPAETAEAIVDGWLHTGDVAELDADGYLYLRDRIKDMIISGGENVYPAEIEEVLLRHPGIRDAAVIGVVSQRWGESPVAVVVASDPGLEVSAVLAYTSEHLARFKQPVDVVFVDTIPRNATGKALKRDLRDQFGGEC